VQRGALRTQRLPHRHRDGHCSRCLHVKAGIVKRKSSAVWELSFETAIIERCRRRGIEPIMPPRCMKLCSAGVIISRLLPLVLSCDGEYSNRYFQGGKNFHWYFLFLRRRFNVDFIGHTNRRIFCTGQPVIRQ